MFYYYFIRELMVQWTNKSLQEYREWTVEGWWCYILLRSNFCCW